MADDKPPKTLTELRLEAKERRIESLASENDAYKETIAKAVSDVDTALAARDKALAIAEKAISRAPRSKQAALKAALEKPSVAERLAAANVADYDNLAKREKEAREMVHILPGVAIRGQATVIYAEPNSGKTLLTCWLLKRQHEAGALGDLKVVYCNLDDDFTGCNIKGRYFADTSITMIDGVNLTPEDVLEMIDDVIEDGTASDYCFILDTLIRVVSDSNKDSQRAFTGLVQRFIGAGGSIIALGHTNKHKNADGKSVHGGTSDIRNSFSQSAMIEIQGDKEAKGTRQVKIRNDKLRGMAQCSNVYSYEHGTAGDWLHRVSTVKAVGEEEAQANVEAFLATEQRKKDQPIIDFIVSMLKRGAMSTFDILNADLKSRETPSRSERERVLNDYCGQDWQRSKGQTGGWNYFLEDWQPDKISKPWEVKTVAML